MKILAVIPAYNEERNVAEVVGRTAKYVDGVLLVDDGSKDKTLDAARSSGAFAIKLATNMGVGFATRTGCEIALKEGADVIVTLDADSQHDPETIPLLLEKLDEGYDVVLASRMIDSKGMPFSKQIGNRFISACCGLFFGSKLSDTQTGFRAIRKEAYKKMQLECDGYEVCSEFAYELSRKGLKYVEIPIKANYDEWTRVKGTSMTTGLKIFFWIMWLRLAK